MDTRTRLLVQAIDPARLDEVRAAATDGHGNPVHPFAASGEGEPLRCCLRYAEPGEQITLNYDHNTVVADDADLEPIVERLLREPDVRTVHVRTLAPQCFLYAVTAAP